MAKMRECYLIVKADGDVRVVKRMRGSLADDEFAVRVIVHLPGGFGRVIPATVDIDLPAAPSVDVSPVSQDVRVRKPASPVKPPMRFSWPLMPE